jgi:hypothetical protein
LGKKAQMLIDAAEYGGWAKRLFTGDMGKGVA